MVEILRLHVSILGRHDGDACNGSKEEQEGEIEVEG